MDKMQHLQYLAEQLTRIHQQNPEFVTQLLQIFIPCHKADDVEVIAAGESFYLANMLGFLNSLFAYAEEDNYFRISASWEGNQITSFMVAVVKATNLQTVNTA